jgi:hypothetical protein
MMTSHWDLNHHLHHAKSPPCEVSFIRETNLKLSSTAIVLLPSRVCMAAC